MIEFYELKEMESNEPSVKMQIFWSISTDVGLKRAKVPFPMFFQWIEKTAIEASVKMQFSRKCVKLEGERSTRQQVSIGFFEDGWRREDGRVSFLAGAILALALLTRT